MMVCLVKSIFGAVSKHHIVHMLRRNIFKSKVGSFISIFFEFFGQFSVVNNNHDPIENFAKSNANASHAVTSKFPFDKYKISNSVQNTMCVFVSCTCSI